MLEHLGLGIVLTMEDEFTPQANKAMQTMSQFENKVDVMSKNVSKSMNNLQNLMLAGFSLNTMGGDFMKAGKNILGFYKNMASELININSEFDTIGASFETVFGDLAQEKLEWALDFSIKTPFQIKDTTRAMSGLSAVGLDVTQQVKSATGEMVPLLQAMGDLSTRNTGARGGIAGMMEAVSNLYGGDGGRSLRARFDIPKTYIEELKSAVDEGGEVFAQKFADLANQLTPNAMKNMLGTWEQILAEMEDTWEGFVWKVGKAGAFDSAKRTLSNISKALGEITSNEETLQSIANVFNAVWKPVDAISNALIKATTHLTNFISNHPKLSEFIGIGVAIGGGFLVASGAVMKLAGSTVVLGASIASLYLNWKLVKGLNLAGEFDFIYKAVSRGFKSFTTFGLILGGFALAFKGRYRDMELSGTKALSRIQSAWKNSTDIMKNGIKTVDMANYSFKQSAFSIFSTSHMIDLLGNKYDSLTLKLTRLRLLGTIIATTLFGDTVDGMLQYTVADLDNFQALGLMPIAQTFAILRGRVESFVEGVTKGIGIAIDICKKFLEVVSKPFISFFDAINRKVKPLGDAFKSIFGIKGLEGMDLSEAEKQIEMFKQLGEVVGQVMGALLAFKTITTITKVITSPFVALGKHLSSLATKLTGFKNSMLGLFGNKNKLVVENNKQSTTPKVNLDLAKKQNDYSEKYLGGGMIPYRGLAGDPFDINNSNEYDSDYKRKQTVNRYTSSGYSQRDAENLYENPNYIRTERRKQVLPNSQNFVQSQIPLQLPVQGTVKSDSNNTTIQPTNNSRIPTSRVRDISSEIDSLGRNIQSTITRTNAIVDVQNQVSAPKIPVSNVRNVTDNRTNTNTNTNSVTRTNTNTVENSSTRFYDSSDFKKIDGRFFNNKTPLSQRDLGTTPEFNLSQSNTPVFNMSTSDLPTLDLESPQTRYINVTNRDDFENRYINATPERNPNRNYSTISNTNITEPVIAGTGYSPTHSFIEQKGYRMSDYTNSSTRTLTSSELEQVKQARRNKLTSGKLGGVFSRAFKIKDRVDGFMNEYNDLSRVQKQDGQYSRVYTSQMSNRARTILGQKDADTNNLYVKNRTGLMRGLFGDKYYQKDINTGEMTKLGSYGGRLKADKDDRQTRLAIEKSTEKQSTGSGVSYYHPKPSDYIGNSEAYKHDLTMRPKMGSEVGSIKNFLDPRANNKIVPKGNNLEQFGKNTSVFKDSQNRLSRAVFGQRYYANATNANGDLYKHVVARQGGLMNRLTGNGNRIVVKDEGDTTFKGRVNKITSPITNAVSNTGAFMGNAFTGLGSYIGSSRVGRTVGGAVGAVRGTKIGHALTTREGLSNTGTKLGNFFLGKRAVNGYEYQDSMGQIQTGQTVTRKGGIRGMLFGNKQVDSMTGQVTGRKGGLLGVAKGAGKVTKGAFGLAGKAIGGVGRLATGALSLAPLAMAGVSLGSTLYNGIKAKGDGDFSAGLTQIKEQTKSINFSEMWNNMKKGAQEIMPIVKDIISNVFQSLARDLPSILNEAWEGLKAGASLAWGFVKENGLAMFSGFLDFVITDGVPMFMESLKVIGTWIVTDGIPFAWNAFLTIVKWIGTDFVPLMVTEFISLATELGKIIWEGLCSAFSGVLTWAKETFGAVWDFLFGGKEVEVRVNQTITTTTETATPIKTNTKTTTTDTLPTAPNPINVAKSTGVQVHHGGLWMSENEHPAIIRKDETVLPPNKSRQLDTVLDLVSSGTKINNANNQSKVEKQGDSISIDKVEVNVQADKLSREDAKAQALLVIEEIKRLNKRNNIKNFMY